MFQVKSCSVQAEFKRVLNLCQIHPITANLLCAKLNSWNTVELIS